MKIKFKKIECPVCKKFYFSEKLEDMKCYCCGWMYDYDQAINKDLKNKKNKKSVNELIEEYNLKISNNPKWNYLDSICPPDIFHDCPVCHKYKFKDLSSYEICPFCGWQDDLMEDDDPNIQCGANEMSLNDYIKEYNKRIKENPNYKWINKK